LVISNAEILEIAEINAVWGLVSDIRPPLYTHW